MVKRKSVKNNLVPVLLDDNKFITNIEKGKDLIFRTHQKLNKIYQIKKLYHIKGNTSKDERIVLETLDNRKFISNIIV